MKTKVVFGKVWGWGGRSPDGSCVPKERIQHNKRNLSRKPLKLMTQRYSGVEFASGNSLVSTSERFTYGSLQITVNAGVKIERQIKAIRVLLRASTEIGRNWCDSTASTTITSEILKFLTKSSSIKTLSQKWVIICHFNLKKIWLLFCRKINQWEHYVWSVN